MIVLVVGLLIGITILVVGGSLAFAQKPGHVSLGRFFRGIALAFVGIVVAFLSLGFTEVGVGHVGVVTTFGRIHEQTLAPGLHWRLPFIEAVSAMDTRVQVYTFENVEGASSDLQPVNLTGIVNFHLDPSAAATIVQRVGVDYKDKVFVRPADTMLKSVTPRFRAADIIAKRGEIGALTASGLQEAVGHYGIIVDAVSVANIGLSAEFLASVEEKVRAEQQAETERRRIEISQAQAQQAIEIAKGDAQAQVERANGQAEANRLVAESLSEPLLQWQYIDRLTDNVQVIYLPSNQQFLLPLPQSSPTP